MTLIKICGITNLKDAILAAENAVDAIGFVCDPNSPRYVTPETFLAIHAVVPRRVKRVGVFPRGWSPEWTREGRDVLTYFDRIQYGEDSVWSQIVGENWDMRRKIRAFRLERQADVLTIASYNGLTQSYLINVHLRESPEKASADERGWYMARQLHQFGRRLYLSGGLTADNVGRAVARAMPYAVDVNVGVESHPGFKDAFKLRDFVQAVRAIESVAAPSGRTQ